MAITRAFKTAVHLERRKTPLVINGDMAVAQRGTTVTGLGDGDEGYTTVDRMRQTVTAGAGRYTCKQTEDAPSDSGFDRCIEFDCTTADTSIAADEYFGMDYRIEGHDVQHLKWGTSDAEYLTVGFWMKCDAAIAYSVGFINSDNSRHIRSLFTTSTSWTYHCIPFVGDTNSGPNDDFGEGLRLRFIFHGGSNITSGTLATTWETTTAANQHVGGGSFFASTDRSIKITGLQLERGYFTSETMPPFQFESRHDSLMRCNRYFHKRDDNSGYAPLGPGVFENTTTALVICDLPTSMRTTPSCTFSGSITTMDGDTFDTATTLSSKSNGTEAVRLTVGSSTGVDNSGATLHIENSTSAVLFDSEL